MSVYIERLATYSSTFGVLGSTITISNLASICPIPLGRNATIVVTIAAKMATPLVSVTGISGTNGLSLLNWVSGASSSATNGANAYTLENWVSEDAYWRGYDGDLVIQLSGTPTSSIYFVGITVYTGLKLTSVLDTSGIYTPYSRTSFPAPDNKCKTNSSTFTNNCLLYGSMYAVRAVGFPPVFNDPGVGFLNWNQFNELGANSTSFVLNDAINSTGAGTGSLDLVLDPDPSAPSVYRANLGTISFLKALDVVKAVEDLQVSESIIFSGATGASAILRSLLLAKPKSSFMNMASLTKHIDSSATLLANRRFLETDSSLVRAMLSFKGEDIFSVLSHFGFTESDIFDLKSNFRKAFPLLLYAVLNDKVFFLKSYLAFAVVSSFSMASRISGSQAYTAFAKAFILQKRAIALRAFIKLLIVEGGLFKLLSRISFIAGQPPFGKIYFQLKAYFSTQNLDIFKLKAVVREKFIVSLLSSFSAIESSSINIAAWIGMLGIEVAENILRAMISLQVGQVGDTTLTARGVISIAKILDEVSLKAFFKLPPLVLRAYFSGAHQFTFFLSAYLTRMNFALACYLRKLGYEIDGFALKAAIIDIQTAIGMNLYPSELLLNLQDNTMFLKSLFTYMQNSTLRFQAYLREIEIATESLSLVGLITAIEEYNYSLMANLNTAVFVSAVLAKTQESNLGLRSKIANPQTKLFDVVIKIYSNPKLGR